MLRLKTISSTNALNRAIVTMLNAFGRLFWNFSASGRTTIMSSSPKMPQVMTDLTQM